MGRKPKLETRDKILCAGYKLFHERGFRGVSMENIAQAAGVKKANLFHYYPTKDALAEELINYAACSFKSSVACFVEKCAADPIKLVTRFFDEHSQQMAECGFRHGCFLGNLAQELSDHHESLRRKIFDCFHYWEEALAVEFKKAKSARKLKAEFNPAKTAQALIALLEGALLFSKASKTSEPLRSAKDFGLSYIRGFLTGKK